ncbi:hypothetical protein V497_03911 [Pseudogymnoascus sp. VKM F-4516 (FW-969)]|nr:hypothetical protein V497_03911 [Pseudogymnoascus sp. VKM F-4516 (FW-969)]
MPDSSSVEDRANVIERQASWLWTAVELGGCEWLNIEYCPAPMQLSLIECLGAPPEWDAEISRYAGQLTAGVPEGGLPSSSAGGQGKDSAGYLTDSFPRTMKTKWEEEVRKYDHSMIWQHGSSLQPAESIVTAVMITSITTNCMELCDGGHLSFMHEALTRRR